MRRLFAGFVAVLLFTPFFARAAVFALDAQKEAGVGQIFEVRAQVNTQGEALNAFEGEVTYASDVLALESVSTGSSIVTLWIEPPAEISPGRLRFSGVTPGGYNGSQGLLFRIRFTAQQTGTVLVAFENGRALLNDGRGTQALAQQGTAIVNIRDRAVPTDVSATADTEPPEPFTPVVTRDPSVFDGKYVLVFLTQDKGSGIDHYEVKEGLRGFASAQSPYLLRNQRLDTDIIVKAIDKSGNERAERIPAPRPLGWVSAWQTWVIALVVILAALLRVIWRRKQNTYLGS